MKILVATNNPGKQTEFKKILSQFGFEIVFPVGIGLAGFEVEETGATFSENASLKAKAFAEKSGLLALADDSGLEIRALGGAPGVHSKRFFLGSESSRNQKMIDLLAQKKDRLAQAVCVLCLYDPVQNKTHHFKGIFKGTVGFAERGRGGFGFDTIFIPLGEKKTVAELGDDYKNKVSHRALALKKLKAYLEKIRAKIN